MIVVDDGSTDGTVELIGRYRSRVRLFCQENKGPGAARNVGLRAARGQYVAFLDSDDVWLPWSAATYAKVIRQHDRPVFIAGKPLIFESDADPLPSQPADLKTLEFSDYYASSDKWRWYSASSFVMQREVFLAAGGFTDEWVNAEDADAAMRMGVAGKFVQITSPCTFGYRRHADSAMANVQRSFNGIRRMIIEEQAGRFPGGEARARERTRIIAAYARPLSLALLKEDRAAAWELYCRTFAWQLSWMRWKFLLGFPVSALVGRFRGSNLQE
jgi:hypothetical protein